MNMKSALRILSPRMLVIALALMVVPFTVQAECPGTVQLAGAEASVIEPIGGGPLATFIGTGCVGSLVGANPPITCDADTTPLGSYMVAIWSSENDRTNASLDSGCSFTCDGGTCLVNALGLPVELLEFSTD